MVVSLTILVALLTGAHSPAAHSIRGDPSCFDVLRTHENRLSYHRREVGLRQKRPPRPKAGRGTSTSPRDEQARARRELIEATAAYKESLAKLLVLYEESFKQATDRLAELEKFFAEQVISKRELAESSNTVEVARQRVERVRSEIGAADVLVANTLQELKVAEELAKAPPVPRGGMVSTGAYIRFNGGGRWALTDSANVGAFFASTFGRALPVSAYGQTALHDRLGYDHSSALDVAVHPDTAEGRSLMGYLRRAGIPFLAFRSAIPGAATGPHIHIGRPSHRVQAP
jgi:hypothetical protein